MSSLSPALAGARPVPYWLDQPGAPDPLPPLRGRDVADLAVVGGGYTGLWTALLAKEADPGRDVVLLEGRKIAWAGSGRNGGFCSASLTHGLANGLARFPGEMPTLDRLGQANLDEIEQTVARYGIDCDFSSDRGAGRGHPGLAGRCPGRGGRQRPRARCRRRTARRRGRSGPR